MYMYVLKIQRISNLSFQQVISPPRLKPDRSSTFAIGNIDKLLLGSIYRVKEQKAFYLGQV
jgi:hypothetical protein